MILQAVLTELLTNAVQHGDDPEVSVAFDAAAHTLSVVDTGPGIPDLEIEVLRTGTETPNKHGQGLGLWLVKWGVDRLGGSIHIDADGSGTRVEITLPAATLLTEAASVDPGPPIDQPGRPPRLRRRSKSRPRAVSLVDLIRRSPPGGSHRGRRASRRRPPGYFSW